MFRSAWFSFLLMALPAWADGIQLVDPLAPLPPPTLEPPAIFPTPGEARPTRTSPETIVPEPVFAPEPVTPSTHPYTVAPTKWSWFPGNKSHLLLDFGGVATFASLKGDRVPSANFASIAPWRFPDFADPGPKIAGGGTVLLGWEFGELPLSLFSRVQSYGASRQIDSHITDPNYAAFAQTPIMQRLRNQTGELTGWPLDQSAGLGREFYRNSILSGLPDPYASVVQKSRLAATTLDFASEVRILQLDVSEPIRGQLFTGTFWWWISGGLRYGNFFYEDIAQGRGIDQRANNSFNGWGPVLGTRIGLSALSIGFDFGYLSGESRQIYSETMTTPNPFRYAYLRETKNIQVPVTRLEVKMPFPFFWWLPMTSSISYQYERWWNVGNVGGSNFSLYSHGIVVKLVWNY